MMQALLLGAGLLGALLLGAYWFTRAEPRTVLQVGRIGGGIVLGAIAILLLVSGRLPYALATLAFALPMLLRLRALRNYARAAFGPSEGQRSRLTTRFLIVTLDHDTGTMDGEVREGRFAGQALSALDADAIDALLHEVAADPQSHQVLRAYIQRRFGADAAGGDGAGFEGGGTEAPRGGGAMSETEAYQVLGLEPGAGEAEIKSAHRRLMRQFHPDQGGSAYFAAKLNQARDLLLAGRGRRQS